MPAERSSAPRTVGIEEELLVVDRESGRPLALAASVLARARERGEQPPSGGGPGGSLEPELQRQQVETDTPVRTRLADLEDDVREWRDVAIHSAHDEGARIVAAATSPLPVTPVMADDARYRTMAERFGVTLDEHLVCGCHVHVGIESADEGVAVLDRLRPWLPVLLALSANSPFWQGEDSGYQSYRSRVMARWPTAGPYDAFGSAAGYRRTVRTMLRTGVPLDEQMVYFDARLSSRYPTVEIRVADVFLDARDAVLHAALCRALVETAARAWGSGEPAPDVPVTLLRLASWQAGREGLDGNLLDPVTLRPRPAWSVVDALVEHVHEALVASGDADDVLARVAGVRERGTGAQRQRTTLERTGRMADVVADLARVTAGQD